MFVEFTVIVTVAIFESASPSFALYVKLSVPFQSASGSYTNEPSSAKVNVPWLTSVTRTDVRASESASVSPSSTPGAAIVSVPFSLTEYVSSSATGGVFVELTVIVTVAIFESASPSFALYVKLSVPFQSASGSYTNEPSSAKVNVPWLTSVTRTDVRASESASVSPSSTPGAAIVSVPFSLTEYVSSSATGGVFVEFTVIFTVPSALPPFPSDTV